MLWLNKFEPRAVIDLLPRATVFMGVPTLYTRLLADPALTREAASHMRLFISGSAPLLIETFTQWQERTGHTILERYGMSETIMLTSNPYQADPRHGGQFERRGATVGFPLPGVELRVVGRRGATGRGGGGGGHPGAWPQRVQWLLAHARKNRRRVHHRWLLQDRRRGQDRRARLRDHRRAQQRPHHLGWLQRVPGRDRGRAQPDARCGRKRGGGRASPRLRRGWGWPWSLPARASSPTRSR